jgi:hypothetical protein
MTTTAIAPATATAIALVCGSLYSDVGIKTLYPRASKSTSHRHNSFKKDLSTDKYGTHTGTDTPHETGIEE